METTRGCLITLQSCNSSEVLNVGAGDLVFCKSSMCS